MIVRKEGEGLRRRKGLPIVKDQCILSSRLTGNCEFFQQKRKVIRTPREKRGGNGKKGESRSARWLKKKKHGGGSRQPYLQLRGRRRRRPRRGREFSFKRRELG